MEGAVVRAETSALSAISSSFVVSDLHQAVTFYRERFGFAMAYQTPKPTHSSPSSSETACG
jgi:predicted enzyme related to lactoylglutathione lyase